MPLSDNIDYSPDYISVLFSISTFSSALISLVTCIIYFLFAKLSQNYPGRLVFIIALCDFIVWGNRFINILAKLFSGSSFEERNDIYCILSSFLCCYFGLVNLMATFLIVFSIFLETVFFINPKRYEKLGYAISFSISCLMALVPYALDHYDVFDAYQCWIVNSSTNFFIFYLPVLIVFISHLLFIGYILYYLNKMKNIVSVGSLCKKLMLFPTILMVAWTPGLIRDLTEINNNVLQGFMYFCMPLQGVFNPFIYGSIFNIIVGKKKSIVPHRKKNDDKNREDIKSNTQTQEDEINDEEVKIPEPKL